jgi:hypothetical protein
LGLVADPVDASKALASSESSVGFSASPVVGVGALERSRLLLGVVLMLFFIEKVEQNSAKGPKIK